MNLFPHLSPLWYAVPMVLLLTAQLIILFYRYLPMAKKDYAPPERRRAILGLGSYSAVYLLALIELAGRCGLLPLTTSCLFPWSFAVMAFFWGAPRQNHPDYRKGEKRWPIRLLGGVSMALALLCWLA